MTTIGWRAIKFELFGAVFELFWIGWGCFWVVLNSFRIGLLCLVLFLNCVELFSNCFELFGVVLKLFLNCFELVWVVWGCFWIVLIVRVALDYVELFGVVFDLCSVVCELFWIVRGCIWIVLNCFDETAAKINQNLHHRIRNMWKSARCFWNEGLKVFNIYIYIYIHTYIYIYIHAYIYAYIHTYIYIYIAYVSFTLFSDMWQPPQQYLCACQYRSSSVSTNPSRDANSRPNRSACAWSNCLPPPLAPGRRISAAPCVSLVPGSAAPAAARQFAPGRRASAAAWPSPAIGCRSPHSGWLQSLPRPHVQVQLPRPQCLKLPLTLCVFLCLLRWLLRRTMHTVVVLSFHRSTSCRTFGRRSGSRYIPWQVACLASWALSKSELITQMEPIDQKRLTDMCAVWCKLASTTWGKRQVGKLASTSNYQLRTMYYVLRMVTSEMMKMMVSMSMVMLLLVVMVMVMVTAMLILVFCLCVCI